MDEATGTCSVGDAAEAQQEERHDSAMMLEPLEVCHEHAHFAFSNGEGKLMFKIGQQGKAFEFVFLLWSSFITSGFASQQMLHPLCHTLRLSLQARL